MTGKTFHRGSALAWAAGWGLLALVQIVQGGPPPGDEGSGGQAPPLTRQDYIAQVVEQLNARAVAPAIEVSETGEPRGKPGPAARALFAAPAEGLICTVDVMIAAADTATNTNDVSAKLLADPRITSVTVVDTQSVTPTFAELMAFDSVMVWTNSTPLDSPTLGDNLADYIDAGGGVVLTMFAMQASIAARTIQGRFLTDNYYCIERTVAGSVLGFATLGPVLVPGHVLMNSVASFDGGGSSFRASGGLHPQATRVADWSTGEILIAARQDLAGRRVDLGFFPVSNDVVATYWNTSTDGATMLANAMAHAGGCPNVGLAGCPDPLFAQSPPDPLLESRNSNTQPNNSSTQQIADDFSLVSGGTVSRVVLWAVFTDNNTVPTGQRFVLNFFSDAAGDPGSIVHTSTVIAAPQYTGEIQTGFMPPRHLYRFVIDLPQPFLAAPGTTYWLNPLGDNNAQNWSWQFLNTTGTRKSRASDTSAWSTFGEDMAFQLCGDSNCPADLNGDGVVNVLDLLLMLGAWGGC